MNRASEGLDTLLAAYPGLRALGSRRFGPYLTGGAILTSLLFLSAHYQWTYSSSIWLPQPGIASSATAARPASSNRQDLFAGADWSWSQVEAGLSDGQCRFVSPLDGLSAEERRIAAEMQFEEVTPGVVRAKGDGQPILGLLLQGEERYRRKLDGQSGSLEEAVATYKMKWNRDPPKGFDRWYHYARSKGILLIDKFDDVMNSLLPFYGLPVASMQERLDEAEALLGTVTVTVRDGNLLAANPAALDDWPGVLAGNTLTLLEPIAHLLEDVTFTISPSDEPRVVLNASTRAELRAAALDHRVIDLQDRHVPKPTSYRSACNQRDGAVATTLDPQSFILNHKMSMNPCTDTSQLSLHGHYVAEIGESSRELTRLLPMLAPTTSLVNGDIALVPWRWTWDTDERAADERPWEAKIGKIHWQGRTTGLDHNEEGGRLWRQSHRERLVALGNDKNGRHTAYLDPGPHPSLHSNSRKDAAQRWLDVKFGDNPIQCWDNDGTCEEMANEYRFAPVEDQFRSDDFKYLIDVDGNGWSSRMRRLLSTNNVLLKSTVFPEFYADAFPEWFAYVPSKLDYSDIFSIMSFFAGEKRSEGHDEVARRIAHNGMCWVQRAWREADAEVYMFRLLIEFARVSSPLRDDGQMDFVLEKKHEAELEHLH